MPPGPAIDLVAFTTAAVGVRAVALIAARDVRRLVVPGDLNELAVRAGNRFPAILRAALRGTRPARQLHAGRDR